MICLGLWRPDQAGHYFAESFESLSAYALPPNSFMRMYSAIDIALPMVWQYFRWSSSSRL